MLNLPGADQGQRKTCSSRSIGSRLLEMCLRSRSRLSVIKSAVRRLSTPIDRGRAAPARLDDECLSGHEKLIVRARTCDLARPHLECRSLLVDAVSPKPAIMSGHLAIMGTGTGSPPIRV
jgi:hypothetical protein